MKKLLGIVVLGLLFSTSVFAEIVLNKCFQKPDKEFLGKEFREYYIDIDPSLGLIKVVYYYTPEAFKKEIKSMEEDGFETKGLRPLVITPYKISLIDDDKILGLSVSSFLNEEITVDIRNNKADVRDLNSSFSYEIFCSSRKKDSHSSDSTTKTRKRREELSILASKSIKKEDVEIVVKFN